MFVILLQLFLWFPQQYFSVYFHAIYFHCNAPSVIPLHNKNEKDVGEKGGIKQENEKVSRVLIKRYQPCSFIYSIHYIVFLSALHLFFTSSDIGWIASAMFDCGSDSYRQTFSCFPSWVYGLFDLFRLLILSFLWSRLK